MQDMMATQNEDLLGMDDKQNQYEVHIDADAQASLAIQPEDT